MKSDQRICVLMLGPSLKDKGGMTECEKIILKHIPNNIDVHFVGTFISTNIIEKIFIFSFSILKILFYFLKYKVNIVHIHFSKKGSIYRKSLIVILIRLFKKKIILHAHGSEFKDFYLSSPKAIQKIISYILNSADKLIVLSHSWQDFYCNICEVKKEKIIVLPNPVEIPKNTRKIKKDNLIRFLYLGIINERKGAKRLAQAYKNLSKNLKSKSKLTIAGNGEVEELKLWVKENQLTKNIEVLDWVNDIKKNTLLRESDVFILPSLNEGLPMAMLEAMAHGLAIITSPVGGISEIIKDGYNGMLVNPINISEISNAMSTLIVDKHLLTKLSTEASKTIQDYDINNYISNLRNIYLGVFYE